MGGRVSDERVGAEGGAALAPTLTGTATGASATGSASSGACSIGASTSGRGGDAAIAYADSPATADAMSSPARSSASRVCWLIGSRVTSVPRRTPTVRPWKTSREMRSRGGAPTHSAWNGTGQSSATARFAGSVSSGSWSVVSRRSCSHGIRPTDATIPSVPGGWRTTAAPIRNGTPFMRMRSVASTGEVTGVMLTVEA